MELLTLLTMWHGHVDYCVSYLLGAGTCGGGDKDKGGAHVYWETELHHQLQFVSALVVFGF